MRLYQHILVVWILLGFNLKLIGGDEAIKSPRLLPATAEKLPRWRGFNLLEKFYASNSLKPFLEENFQLISKFGFNFVRLPMDYRCWIKDKDWTKFDEKALKQIDQAVEWGGKYGIHVCLNFHRAPGYTVASPPEKTSLWEDPETQRVCAMHWAMFARRYKGINNERLSFNLMNEPGMVKAPAYVAVVRKLVEAIRAEDPDRLIISDGLEWGRTPIPELRELRLAQATRGYSPFELTHYKANWVNSVNFPLPTWPRLLPPNGLLLSPARKKAGRDLIITGPFAAETKLRMHVLTVSHQATLIVEGDGSKLMQKEFQCGPGEGEWKKAIYKSEWKVYQNLFDKDYQASIPAGTKEIRIRNAVGDWLEVGELGFQPEGKKEDTLRLATSWSEPAGKFRYAPGNKGVPFPDLPVQGTDWLWQTTIQPWKDLEARGTGVMVGEWGAHNKTPHDVTLRWAEDCLKNWQKAGWGWALWNFRGSFGIMDSGRTDVPYEDCAGHKLDRKFLELLQRY